MSCLRCTNLRYKDKYIPVCKENDFLEIRVDINEVNSCPYFTLKEEEEYEYE